MTIREKITEIVWTKASAVAGAILLAVLGIIVAGGEMSLNMLAERTKAAKDFRLTESRIVVLEQSFSNFVDAFVDVNPELGAALDRRRALQDSARHRDSLHRERLRVLEGARP